ncbi:MAG: sugar ABC transporter ATP-binding protein [Deinococcota bacterium]
MSLLSLSAATKHYGAVTALAGVDVTIHPGSCVGLIGHNGAGKSTLSQIMAGTLTMTSGQLVVEGNAIDAFTARRAHELGIRCVFQELSLCPNLTVIENTRLMHRDLRGWGWRNRARKLIQDSLDTIFPDHGVPLSAQIASLPLVKRQMVEIARAFTMSDNKTDAEIKLIILDEPTSSLDATSSAQLLNYLHSFVQAGGSCVFISHMLNEVLEVAERIIVMRDAQVVADKLVTSETGELRKDDLVALMGDVAAEVEQHSQRQQAGEVVISQQRTQDAATFQAAAHEVIGIGGLAGHGQDDFLRTLMLARKQHPKRAFIAGDRQRDGVFPLWSIRKNISPRAYQNLQQHGLRRGFVDGKAETALAEQWRTQIGIRTPHVDEAITSLSGGNQQKTLFARALASDAEVILMDDPLRGVDVGTKQDIYAMIQTEASGGRCFIWYSTEIDELFYCDRVYVFRNGGIVEVLEQPNISEASILEASF